MNYFLIFFGKVEWPQKNGTRKRHCLAKCVNNDINLAFFCVYFYKNDTIFHSKQHYYYTTLIISVPHFARCCVLVEVVCVCLPCCFGRKCHLQQKSTFFFVFLQKRDKTSCKTSIIAILLILMYVDLACYHMLSVLMTDTLTHFPSVEIANTRDWTNNWPYFCEFTKTESFSTKKTHVQSKYTLLLENEFTVNTFLGVIVEFQIQLLHQSQCEYNVASITTRLQRDYIKPQREC